MRKICFFVWMFLGFANIQAQTQVSGNQYGIWSPSDSPYHVVGTITIPQGQNLEILAGVTIVFDGHYQFIVNGKLQASGTETDSIFFTTDDPDTGWGGIRITSDKVSELAFCRIEFGKTGLNYPDNVGGGLALFNSNAVVTNCVFADNKAPGDEDGFGGAVYAINAGGGDTSMRFEQCTFIRNEAYGEGGAIKLSNDFNTEIIGCTFLDNHVRYGGGALAFYSSVNVKIARSLFANNYTTYSNGGAVVALGFGNSLNFEHCTITNNSANNGEGGGINLAYATANIVNTIIYNNPGQYGDNLVLSQNGEAEVNYSNLEMPDLATGSNNINEDPVFLDPANGDFHLADLSPCIDAGTDVGEAFAGMAPDMGCYEFGVISGMDVLAQKKGWSLCPNPAVDWLVVKSVQVVDNVQVVNLWGQVVLSKDISCLKEFELDLSSLSGFYTIRLSRNGAPIGTQKIVVE